MRWLHGVSIAAALAIGTPLAASAQGRFNGIDRNRDGVITRAEWPGNDTSFRQHDRNRDGLLSGGEVRREWRLNADNGNGKSRGVKANKPHKPHKAHKGHNGKAKPKAHKHHGTLG